MSDGGYENIPEGGALRRALEALRKFTGGRMANALPDEGERRRRNGDPQP